MITIYSISTKKLSFKALGLIPIKDAAKYSKNFLLCLAKLLMDNLLWHLLSNRGYFSLSLHNSLEVSFLRE